MVLLCEEPLIRSKGQTIIAPNGIRRNQKGDYEWNKLNGIQLE